MPQVIISPDFFDAVGGLDAQTRGRVLDFLGRFQKNPANPGISLERVTKARSKDVWSGRITDDLRAVLHQDGEVWALLYADRHDEAYRWAQRFEVGRHPVTGALEVVEVVTRVEERVQIVEVEPEFLLFQPHSDEYLLSLGVPPSWLPTLRKVSTDDQLLDLLPSLPQDLGDRLVDLASGKIVAPPKAIAAHQPAIASPDTLSRFYVVESDADLQAVLNAPMEKWLAFLHPTQRSLATGSFSGPVKVTGSAGTGKTVVALHRARHLARQGRRVLLTTFVNTLADNLRRNLALLCTPEESKLITVSTVHAEALALVRRVEPQVRPISEQEMKGYVLAENLTPFDADFLLGEWSRVVCAQGVTTWAEYRAVSRTGRGRPLSVADRKEIWKVMEGVRGSMAADGCHEFSGLVVRAHQLLLDGQVESPYDAVVVDEVQDLKPHEMRLLAALAGAGADRLMLVGDAGQRIYPGGFSLRSLGIETRGRSHILRINYRTTEQIRAFADRVLDEAVDDLEGGRESRKGTRSLLKGPVPEVRSFADPLQEVRFVLEQIREALRDRLQPAEIAVFSRTSEGLKPVEAALLEAGIPVRQLKDRNDETWGVQLGTMHRAKGLEFKLVFVTGCSDGELPNRKALQKAGDDPADREEALENEKRLLYVSLTRARDEVLVTCVGRPCQFLPTAAAPVAR